MRWSPRTIETAGTAAVAALAVLLAVTSTDRPGRLIFGTAAVLLAGSALVDIVLGPRLRADAHGLQVRSLAMRRSIPWAEVHGVAVDERVRYGLVARALEIDLGDTLAVFGRRSLGADPREVADALERIRAGSAGGSARREDPGLGPV